MRHALLFLTAFTCACGAAPMTHDNGAPLQGEALSLESPALLNFNVRSAAFDTYDNGLVQSMFIVLSDTDDVCTQMQAHRSTANSRRISVELNHPSRGSDMVGRYPLRLPNTPPSQDASSAIHAEAEMLDPHCQASKPPIGSGDIRLQAVTDQNASASIRLALAALGMAGLGTFDQDVTMQRCKGINHADAIDRSRWTCIED